MEEKFIRFDGVCFDAFCRQIHSGDSFFKDLADRIGGEEVCGMLLGGFEQGREDAAKYVGEDPDESRNALIYCALSLYSGLPSESRILAAEKLKQDLKREGADLPTGDNLEKILPEWMDWQQKTCVDKMQELLLGYRMEMHNSDWGTWKKKADGDPFPWYESMALAAGFTYLQTTETEELRSFYQADKEKTTRFVGYLFGVLSETYTIAEQNAEISQSCSLQSNILFGICGTACYLILIAATYEIFKLGIEVLALTGLMEILFNVIATVGSMSLAVIMFLAGGLLNDILNAILFESRIEDSRVEKAKELMREVLSNESARGYSKEEYAAERENGSTKELIALMEGD